MTLYVFMNYSCFYSMNSNRTYLARLCSLIGYALENSSKHMHE
jgi:hypothetical protein